MAAGKTTARLGDGLKAYAMNSCPRWCAAVVLGLSLVVPFAAEALPLTPFRGEAQAQRHCPGDTVVWLDFRKEVYYLKSGKQYGQGSTGSFACEKEVRASGFRRSLLGIRRLGELRGRH
jgi:hypothetical protein